MAAERGLNGALVRALLGGVSPHEFFLAARIAGGRYEGGSEKRRREVRMVLEWEMDDAGDGERERGGMIEAEDDEGGAEAGPEAEAEEETTIEGAGRGMGTDMVVMSDAISSSYALGLFVAFSSWWLCWLVFCGTSPSRGGREIRIGSNDDCSSQGVKTLRNVEKKKKLR